MAVDDITAGAHDNSNDRSTPGGGGEADRLGPDVWKITAVTVAGTFMAQLSTTMVNVSLLSLAAELHASLSTIQWVTSGYLLSLALILPLNGWLVERIGARALCLWCFSAFTLCGVAWSANALIAFRILQGMSGGLMAPMMQMMQMMIARAAGKHMARIIGYAAVPAMLGPILGPVIAGAILQYASWRWLLTLCATFLGWRLSAAPSPAVTSDAFAEAFGLLCFLHLLLFLATLRLPWLVPDAAEPIYASEKSGTS